MELSILVARIVALTYLSAGIAALSGKISFSKVVEEFEKNTALTFIAGLISIVLGMILVTYHNIWVKNWTVLITIIGWMSLLKGIMLIVLPQSISFFKNWYKNTRAWGFLMITVGLIFGYFGFLI